MLAADRRRRSTPPIDAAVARSAICIAITGLNAHLLGGTIGLMWLGMIVGAMLAFALWVHFINKPRPVAPPAAASSVPDHFRAGVPEGLLFPSLSPWPALSAFPASAP